MRISSKALWMDEEWKRAYLEKKRTKYFRRIDAGNVISYTRSAYEDAVSIGVSSATICKCSKTGTPVKRGPFKGWFWQEITKEEYEKFNR